jgi:tRNA dimethylallyltransferase
LLDVLDPWESANVAWWLEQALRLCREIQARGRSVLIVGGTPLYLKALLHGIFAGPPANAQVRRRLETSAQETGSADLHAALAKLDPETAARLHPNDARRIIRALEVWEVTGRPISQWQQQWGENEANEMIRCRWIERPRSELYSRINARVEQMFEQGWVDEVKRLRALPKPMSREASQALGYAEIGAFLDGTIGLAETIAAIQTRSRQFAKRQLTWFRHLPSCQPLPVTGNAWPAATDWMDLTTANGEKVV